VATLVPEIESRRHDQPRDDVNGKKFSMTDRMRELFEGSERQLFVNPQKDFLNEVF
jgi:hypothetical protein